MDLEKQISILIPVFNGANYLSQTIESILSNTNESTVEVIVINDGSTDETEQICSNYDGKIKYISQANQGEFAATNEGLNHASGKYIMVVSHDDPMLSADLIPRALDVLETKPNLVCVYPDWQIINANGEIISKKVVREFSELELIGKMNCLPGPGAVFRKNAALEIKGRRKWKFVSDYDFWLRLSRLGEFERIPGVRAQWRSHQNSTTVSMKSFDMAQERIAVMKNFLDTNQVDPRIARMGKSSAYYLAARLGVFSNRIPAKKWLAISFLTRRRWPEVANPFIVLFILSLPLSRVVLNLVLPFSKRLREVF
jgi:glycosyltransferase involved in cell wall biosynthesis